MDEDKPITTKKDFMRQALGLDDQATSEEDQLVSRKPVGVPNISPFADWDYYYLLAPIEWVPEGDAAGQFQSVEAPRGFVTDLASIPKVLWSVLPPTSRYTHAAIIHDFLYWTQTVSRSEADEILRIGMGELDVAGWKTFSIYKAVSMFGSKAWEHNAKLKAQGESRFLRKLPKEPTITWEDWKSRRGVLRT